MNRLALGGEAPDAFASWESFHEVLVGRREELRELVALPVQTNEVGRSAPLLFGFLTVAARWGLPLRTLELGASAGLNSNWDRYRYDVEGLAWGPADSTLRLGDWRLLHRMDAKGANNPLEIATAHPVPVERASAAA